MDAPGAATSRWKETPFVSPTDESGRGGWAPRTGTGRVGDRPGSGSSDYRYKR